MAESPTPNAGGATCPRQFISSARCYPEFQAIPEIKYLYISKALKPKILRPAIYGGLRHVAVAACMISSLHLHAQSDDNWIAPEGFILNYRTLNWNDFKGREDRVFSDKLATQNLQAKAYVSPAIYFVADSGETQPNGRVKFKFHVKCAFQSSAFVRESTKNEHSNYVLIHEQDHYDIALVYAGRLQSILSSRDYSADKYNEEIDKLGNDLLDKYNKTQEIYDNEVNPNGTDDQAKQYLWDMRIRKCMENNTDEFFASTESAVQNVKLPGQIVKRLPGEPALQFIVRARPLYMELPPEMMPKVVETREWSQEPAVIAFYTQKFYVHEDGALPTDHFRTMAYMFIPTTKDLYKRVIIDTFNYDGRPVKITGAFFTNADNDAAKELVITATSTQKDKDGSGTMYINRVYDNADKPLPGKLKRLDDVSVKIEGGFEGSLGGKPSKAKCKSSQEITDALKKLGYN